MNNTEQFNECLRAAKIIVRAYREQAPDGFDPKNTWVAVAGTVVSVGVGAYSASQANKGSAEDKYGTKVEPVPYEDRVGTEDSYANRIFDETGEQFGLENQGLLGIFELGNKLNAHNRRKRDKVTGGAFSATQQQQGANILAELKGHIPADVASSIDRLVAEHLGGAIDPNDKVGGAFGNNAAANDAARRLGLTSLDISGRAQGAANAFRTNVDSFVYKPQQAFRDIFLPQEQVGLDASRIQMARDEAEYLSANNIARASAMPNPQVTGAANDALTQGAMWQSVIGGATGALDGLVTAGGSGGGGYYPAGTNRIGEQQYRTGTVPRATVPSNAY